MKYGVQLGQIIDVARERQPKAKFIFLTLTVKNVVGEELSAELSRLTKSFDRLFKRAKVKKAVIGYLRAIEVTYNAERDDYHPHIHVLLMVKASYFGGDYYISQDEWTAMWQQSAKLDYKPIVDVQIYFLIFVVFSFQQGFLTISLFQVDKITFLTYYLIR